MIYYCRQTAVKLLHCVLNLSMAFDTVDHQLLLTRLQGRFGVVGKVLD